MKIWIPWPQYSTEARHLRKHRFTVFSNFEKIVFLFEEFWKKTKISIFAISYLNALWVSKSWFSSKLEDVTFFDSPKSLKCDLCWPDKNDFFSKKVIFDPNRVIGLRCMIFRFRKALINDYQPRFGGFAWRIKNFWP